MNSNKEGTMIEFESKSEFNFVANNLKKELEGISKTHRHLNEVQLVTIDEILQKTLKLTKKNAKINGLNENEQKKEEYQKFDENLNAKASKLQDDFNRSLIKVTSLRKNFIKDINKMNKEIISKPSEVTLELCDVWSNDLENLKNKNNLGFKNLEDIGIKEDIDDIKNVFNEYNEIISELGHRLERDQEVLDDLGVLRRDDEEDLESNLSNFGVNHSNKENNNMDFVNTPKRARTKFLEKLQF
ncbi:hypothetical protein HK099_008022 [Clydaea vesicula]|uniref:Uncharacterized protein n=1 Tax=Clydaea vesicula TaxID=447962 RepID=A0AAD5U4Y6_9FUNG|nr:hypothetical protein HK099_008022 [Clydaea vesicula]